MFAFKKRTRVYPLARRSPTFQCQKKSWWRLATQIHIHFNWCMASIDFFSPTKTIFFIELIVITSAAELWQLLSQTKCNFVLNYFDGKIYTNHDWYEIWFSNSLWAVQPANLSECWHFFSRDVTTRIDTRWTLPKRQHQYARNGPADSHKYSRDTHAHAGLVCNARHTQMPPMHTVTHTHNTLFGENKWCERLALTFHLKCFHFKTKTPAMDHKLTYEIYKYSSYSTSYLPE